MLCPFVDFRIYGKLSSTDTVGCLVSLHHRKPWASCANRTEEQNSVSVHLTPKSLMAPRHDGAMG
ncbi:hypothetical protein HOLleu_24649 [Holothuria leucospilota]|uniref:Uncharacterized protein n=1 Tax=Holothuria leucospilota TaxID=206669 RepID=A0A9Q1H3T1_HOLLE|nr:hypothetical protein HOLleu_24649 [Holothuria leucospilota]